MGRWWWWFVGAFGVSARRPTLQREGRHNITKQKGRKKTHENSQANPQCSRCGCILLLSRPCCAPSPLFSCIAGIDQLKCEHALCRRLAGRMVERRRQNFEQGGKDRPQPPSPLPNPPKTTTNVRPSPFPSSASPIYWSQVYACVCAVFHIIQFGPNHPSQGKRAEGEPTAVLPTPYPTPTCTAFVF